MATTKEIQGVVEDRLTTIIYNLRALDRLMGQYPAPLSGWSKQYIEDIRDLLKAIEKRKPKVAANG